MRVTTSVSKYEDIYHTYLREFEVVSKNKSTLAFMDNQAIVPIGNPDNAISMRGSDHKKSLRSSCSWIGALDHDWKLGDFVYKMKRRYISNEEAINDILRFVEEGDEDLDYEDNLEELYSDEQRDFQLIPGILIKVYC